MEWICRQICEVFSLNISPRGGILYLQWRFGTSWYRKYMMLSDRVEWDEFSNLKATWAQVQEQNRCPCSQLSVLSWIPLQSLLLNNIFWSHLSSKQLIPSWCSSVVVHDVFHIGTSKLCSMIRSFFCTRGLGRVVILVWSYLRSMGINVDQWNFLHKPYRVGEGICVLQINGKWACTLTVQWGSMQYLYWEHLFSESREHLFSVIHWRCL